MLRSLAGVGILLAICLTSPLAAAEEREECLLVEVDFEGVVDATGDLGSLAGIVEKGSRMTGSYRIDSCAEPSGQQPNQTHYMNAIQTNDFDMEIERIRFWPSREGLLQMAIGIDVKSGSDTFDLWSINATDARTDVDMEDAVFSLFLKLSDDTHSVFDSKELVTVPDLSRFSSSRFGVSKTVTSNGRTRSGLYIAGEITRLRYIRSR